MSLMMRFLSLLVPILGVGLIAGIFTWKVLNQGTAQLMDANRLLKLSQESRFQVAEMGGSLKGFLLNPADATEKEKKLKADEGNVKALDEMKSFVKDKKLLEQIETLADLDEKDLNPAENEVMALVDQGRTEEAQKTFVTKYLPLRKKYDELSAELAKQAETVSHEETLAVEGDMRTAALQIIGILIAGLLLASVAVVAVVFRLSGRLNGILKQLLSESKGLSTESTTLSGVSRGLSETTTDQASTLQETVSAVEQVNAMVGRNADNSRQSQGATEQCSDKATEGRQVVSNMMRAIERINESSAAIMKQVEDSNKEINAIAAVISDIGTKTTVINDIVFQTKLLSFNASVEAARAGEQGKGFSVVAEEVGNLAQLSGNAAKEISDMIGESTEKVHRIAQETQSKVQGLLVTVKERLNEGTTIASECESVLSEIVNTTQTATQMMKQVVTASEEQSQGVREINTAMTRFDEGMQKTANVAQTTATTASGLESRAQVLQRLVDDLQGIVAGSQSNSKAA